MSITEKPQTAIIRFRLVDSTNRIALAMAEQGAAHGTVVLADAQSQGKGRMAREFCSPPGGLYVSVVLRPALTNEQVSMITLAAGVAVADAVEAISGISPQLKWPNDLYAVGKKLGGILTESGGYSHDTGSFPYVVVGIGLNVNTKEADLPPAIQHLATSLNSLTGLEFDIPALASIVAGNLQQAVVQLGENGAEVLAAWQQRDLLRGKQLCWQDPQGWVVRGLGNGLLPDGRYRLTTAGGDDYPVLAGDIVLTEINGKQIR